MTLGLAVDAVTRRRPFDGSMGVMGCTLYTDRDSLSIQDGVDVFLSGANGEAEDVAGRRKVRHCVHGHVMFSVEMRGMMCCFGLWLNSKCDSAGRRLCTPFQWSCHVLFVKFRQVIDVPFLCLTG